MADPTSLIDGIAQSMRHLSERQRVISENIANSETPRPQGAREKEAPDFSGAGRGARRQQGRAHVARPRINADQRHDRRWARPRPRSRQRHRAGSRHLTETKPDGNNVTLEETRC